MVLFMSKTWGTPVCTSSQYWNEMMRMYADYAWKQWGMLCRAGELDYICLIIWARWADPDPVILCIIYGKAQVGPPSNIVYYIWWAHPAIWHI